MSALLLNAISSLSSSSSSSLLYFSNSNSNNNNNNNNLNNYSSVILCKYSPSYPQDSNSNSQLNTNSNSIVIGEGVGVGAAAPTRGDIFLERLKAVEAAQLSIQENKVNNKKKKKKKQQLQQLQQLNVNNNNNGVGGGCYGCGAPLQTLDLDAPGYVHSHTYQLKKKHHQLRTVICQRCKLLSHGHIITAVGGHGGYPGGKHYVDADHLRHQLKHLRYQNALILKLVDIVDFNGTFLSRVRHLVGANPIILVITKVDLLPRDTDFNSIADWVVEATTNKKLNVLSVHLTSSKSLVGITGVASEIQKEKKGRDVYILGAANVGKSAFINALLKMMGERDPAAAAALKYKPIQSAVPGTTLGPIQIDAFLSGGKLFDTPGVHLHHRQAAVIHAEDLPALAPQSRLRGQSFPNDRMTSDNLFADKLECTGLNGFSIFWGGLVRIDILEVLPETSLTFYGPKALKIHLVPTDKADEFYQNEVGVSLTPPTGKQRAEEWRGLDSKHHLQIKFDGPKRPASDVAVSGIGWIAIEPIRRSLRTSDVDLGETTGELHLAVHVPKPVEVFVRPPLPVGKAGAEWYQYRDLTEKEEELRPKWYF